MNTRLNPYETDWTDKYVQLQNPNNHPFAAQLGITPSSTGLVIADHTINGYFENQSLEVDFGVAVLAVPLTAIIVANPNR